MVFKPFDKVIERGTEPWTSRSISEPKPTLLDFESNYVTLPKDLLNAIENSLEEKGFCLIIGGPNSGKTWLSYAVCYDLCFLKKKPVWYTAVDEDFEAEDAYEEIAHYYESKVKETIYFVVEDCHIKPNEVEKFLRRVYDIYEQSVVNLRFIFTARKIGRFVLRNTKEEDTFYDIFMDRLKCNVELSSLTIKEIAKGIIRSFVKIRNIEYESLEEELPSIIKKWDSDLYIVYLYLRSWEYQRGLKLTDVDKQKVYDLLWEHYEGVNLKKQPQRQILCRIAAVCQFEPLKVPEDFLRMEPIDDDELNNLIKRGVIQLYPRDLMGVSENLSQLIVLTIANRTKFDIQNYTSQLFNQYLKVVLKELKLPNWQIVFQALHSAKEEHSELAKEILISLLNDKEIWDEIKKNAESLPLGAMSSLITNILPWASRQAREMRSIYIAKNYREIESKVKTSSATVIGRDLSQLSRLVNLNSLFGNLSVTDFQAIIKRSSIYGIRLLFFHFETWNIEKSIRVKLGEALVSLPVSSLAGLIAEHDSLYRLGGLIGNVRKVDEALAKKFIEKLSETNLSELFPKKDLPAEKEALSKAKVVNFFLSKRISFAPEQAKTIVYNIDNKLWFDFIQSASLGEGVWLLWNIYRYNKRKAESLIQENVSSSLLRKVGVYPERTFWGFLGKRKLKDEKLDYYLPLLGLLHECNFNIQKIPVLEKNMPAIKERLKRFEKWGTKEKPEPTLFVLSLITLRVKLPSKEYEQNIKGFILDHEPMHKYVYLHEDPQLREILTNLINRYAL